MSQRQAIPSEESNLPTVAERRRVPMSAPVSRLAVPEIPGYHLHWFLGEPSRIQRALNAGYEWVSPGEVAINDRGLGTDGMDGNTDMGSRVSVIAGGDVGADLQPQRLYLMKLKEELWREDQKTLEGEGSRLENVRQSLLAGRIGADGQSRTDQAQVYLDQRRTKIPSFLQKKAT